MHKHVSFVLRMYDDFSGKILSGKEYRFKINGYTVAPVIKLDGYFVFLGEMRGSCKLSVESLYYESLSKDINIDALDEVMRTVRIRLLPGRHYFDAQSIKLEGTLEKADQDIWLIPKTSKALLKYGGRNKEHKDYIRINMLSPNAILNLNLMPIEELEQNLETFFPIEKQSSNIYRLDHAPDKAYGMATELVRVYHARTRQDGSYTIYIDHFYETTKFILAYKEDQAVITKEVVL